MTFAANRSYHKSDSYYSDNLLLWLRPINCPLDYNKSQFKTPDHIYSTMLQGGVATTGSPEWKNLDDNSITGYPLGSIGYNRDNDLAFMTQAWSNMFSPPTDSGRTKPLSYKVEFWYDTLAGWSASIDTLKLKSRMLVQDYYDIQRQEYYDFSPARVNFQYVEFQGYNSRNIRVGNIIPGTHPLGIHHHYRGKYATQSLPSDTLNEIWWDKSITAYILGRMNAISRASSILYDATIVPSYTSGYRCPVKNNQEGGARGSAHIDGQAVDFNYLIDDSTFRQIADKQLMSNAFYQVFLSFRPHGNRRVPILYGRRTDLEGDEIEFKRSLFVDPDGEALRDYPNPGAVWPLRYKMSNNQIIEVFYTRGHIDTHSEPPN